MSSFLAESTWLAAYRFGNGGRDRQGRPGRFVLLVMAVRREEAWNKNLAPLLQHEAVENILQQARTECPVPAPRSLLIEVPEYPAQAPPDIVEKILSTGRWTSEEVGGFSQLMQIAGLLEPRISWVARFACTGGSSLVTLEIVDHIGKLRGRAERTVAEPASAEGVREGAPSGPWLGRIPDGVSPRKSRPYWSLGVCFVIGFTLGLFTGIRLARFFASGEAVPVSGKSAGEISTPWMPVGPGRAGPERSADRRRGGLFRDFPSEVRDYPLDDFSSEVDRAMPPFGPKPKEDTGSMRVNPVTRNK
ncbi:MAG: hypothetical protein NZ899_15200 [Thermoguttaceae bacterium]|nr:hypothetical protein [Thermoguttaceae bacterium]MDW8080252.1 hypothetical protein [Thermoguttaceae bacterium]